MIEKAKEVHSKFWDVDSILDKHMGLAVRLLVDLITDTGLPKPSKERVNLLLHNLTKSHQ